MRLLVAMKVNNPILDITKPIFIDSDKKWEVISKYLNVLGYRWYSGDLMHEWKPKLDKFYIESDSNKRFSFKEELQY